MLIFIWGAFANSGRYVRGCASLPCADAHQAPPIASPIIAHSQSKKPVPTLTQAARHMGALRSLHVRQGSNPTHKATRLDLLRHVFCSIALPPFAPLRSDKPNNTIQHTMFVAPPLRCTTALHSAMRQASRTV